MSEIEKDEMQEIQDILDDAELGLEKKFETGAVEQSAGTLTNADTSDTDAPVENKDAAMEEPVLDKPSDAKEPSNKPKKNKKKKSEGKPKHKMEKRGKKIVAIAGAAVAVCGIAGAVALVDKKVEESSGVDELILKGTEVDGVQTIYFEYGETIKLEPATFLSDEVSDKVLEEATIEAPFTEVNTEYIFDQDDLTVCNVGDSYLAPSTYAMSITWNDETIDFAMAVQDTVAPAFQDFDDEITVLRDAANVSLADYFWATDVSGDVQINILRSEQDISELDTSSYDQTNEISKEILSAVGDYQIKVIATDKHGLQNQGTCTVHVVEDGDTSTLTTPEGWIAVNDGFVTGSEKEVDDEGRTQMPSGYWFTLGKLAYPTREGEEVVEHENTVVEGAIYDNDGNIISEDELEHGEAATDDSELLERYGLTDATPTTDENGNAVYTTTY